MSNTSGPVRTIRIGGEPKPWERTVTYRDIDSDGKPVGDKIELPNIGSFEVLAACGLVDVAIDTLKKHEADMAIVDPKTEIRTLTFQMTQGHILGLGASLLRICDRVQRRISPDGKIDRMSTGHTRIRGLLRTILKAYPETSTPPFDGTDDDWERWSTTLENRTNGALQSAIQVIELADSDAPWRHGGWAQ